MTGKFFGQPVSNDGFCELIGLRDGIKRARTGLVFDGEVGAEVLEGGGAGFLENALR